MNKPRTLASDYLPPLLGWNYDDLPGEVVAELARVPVEGFFYLTLPFPISANRYWRSDRRRPQPYRSDEATDYKKAVALYFDQQNTARLEPLTGDVRMFCYFYRFNAARDLDNCIKVMTDALNGLAYADDNQIAHSEFIRDYDSKEPRVHVIVYPTQGRDSGKIKSRK